MSPRRFWACHGKDCKGKPCGYQVPVGRTYCDACGHQPPLHVSCPEKAQPAGEGGGKGDANGKLPGKGGGKGCANSKPPNKSAGGGTTLEKQLKAAEAKAQESYKEAITLRAEVKRLKIGADAAPYSAAKAAMELDHNGTEAGASSLEAAISAARDELKQTQALTGFQKSLVPDYAAILEAAHAKVEAALVARRAASPLKKQLEGAEGHQQRSSKKVADAKALLETRRKEVADAQAAVQLQEGVLAELDKVLSKADAQVADLAARFALERNAPAPVETAVAHTADPSGAVVPPGCISIKHAEAVLAEQLALRDAALAQAIAVAEEAPDEPDDDSISVSGSTSGPAAEEGCKKRARKQRAIGAKATIAHVRSHNFAKPKWG
jgi:hypothetical protein